MLTLNVVSSAVSVAKVLLSLVKASNVLIKGGASLNDGSPLLSLSKYFPESRLASKEITTFNDFIAKIFPLPSLLHPNIVS